MIQDDAARGYVTDITYPQRVYHEHAPVMLAYVARMFGHTPPPLDRFHYCDLGCGPATSTLLFADCAPDAQFYGYDLNEAHIQSAQALAKRDGLRNIELERASFHELLQRDTLPLCDYVVAHGVYSWVDDTARGELLALLERMVAPGGLALITYNAQPGSYALQGLRDLMMLEPESAPSRDRIAAAMARLTTLADAKAPFFEVFPTALKRLRKLSHDTDNYIAHEFFNRSWHAAHLAEVVDAMDARGLAWVGSQPIHHNVDELASPAAFHHQLAAIEDRVQRETLRDFICATHFRRDLFVRQPSTPCPDTDDEQVYGTRLSASALRQPQVLEHISLDWSHPIYPKIFAALERGPITPRQLQTAHNVPINALISACFMLLVGDRVWPWVAPITPPKPTLPFASLEVLSAFNRNALQHPPTDDAPLILASPAAGTGVPLSSSDVEALSSGNPPAELVSRLVTLGILG